ncbi:MAG: DUF1697 domain-containing protein [Planctomycetota bacterium]
MQTWIALLRGVNVGGHNRMLMSQLRNALEDVGCRSVRTYIQSGNVVFESSLKSKSTVIKRMEKAIEDEFGFQVPILLMTRAEFVTALENNPFPDAVHEPKTLHFFFLESNPESVRVDVLAELLGPRERFHLISRVLYLYAPDGIARSKFATSVERKLGTMATARNFSTIKKLSSLIAAD